MGLMSKIGRTCGSFRHAHTYNWGMDQESLQPVVAAAIINTTHHQRKLLAAQRSYPPELAGKYELPGGKVEAAEAPLAALEREIREELNCAIKIHRFLPCPNSPEGTWPILGGRRMYVWVAHPLSTPQVGNSHSKLQWVTLPQARALPWLGPNWPIVEAVFNNL